MTRNAEGSHRLLETLSSAACIVLYTALVLRARVLENAEVGAGSVMLTNSWRGCSSTERIYALGGSTSRTLSEHSTQATARGA